jgi:hypothetical protein
MNEASQSSIELYLLWFCQSATFEDPVLQISPLNGETLHGLFFLYHAVFVENLGVRSFTFKVVKFHSVHFSDN